LVCSLQRVKSLIAIPTSDSTTKLQHCPFRRSDSVIELGALKVVVPHVEIYGIAR
jgi:hypothetical protein